MSKKDPLESTFPDPRAQRLSDLWFSQRENTTVEQKNKVGLVFISKFLGLGDETAQRFTQNDSAAYHEVGMKQAAIPVDADTQGFWQEVREIFPTSYQNNDIAFLADECGIQGVLHFLWQIETPLAEQSPILRMLAQNAHVYK